MSRQLDMFAAPTATTIRTCGNCVTRNAFEHEDYGSCAVAGRRHRDDPPCDSWFGLDELRRPLYGRRAA